MPKDKQKFWLNLLTGIGLLTAAALIAYYIIAGSGSAPAVPSSDDTVTVAPAAAPPVEETQTVPLDTVAVHSDKMGRDIKNLVVVPAQYLDKSQPAACYPVLVLLHGADGSYVDWSQRVDLKQIATRHGVIIVCPDADDSWYFDSPVNPRSQYETYLSQELIHYIDCHYRTYRSPCMRAITGLSMGGHGALWTALRHPDVYWSCGSMSGGVNIVSVPDRFGLDKVLGKFAQNKESWQSHSVMSLVPTLKPGQNIIIDDGDRDFFYDDNLALHRALLKQGIPHNFSIRPGRHAWKYWVESLGLHLKFFDEAFAQGRKVMNGGKPDQRAVLATVKQTMQLRDTTADAAPATTTTKTTNQPTDTIQK